MPTSGVEGRCTGYLCVSFSMTTTPHVASDVVCSYNNTVGKGVILDGWSSSSGWPVTDAVDNLLTRAGPVQVDATTRQFTFSRYVLTCYSRFSISLLCGEENLYCARLYYLAS
jgi:hypothetical protein